MFARVHADREVRLSMPAGSGNPKPRKAKAKNFLEKAKRFPGLAWRMAWKVGKEDPRRGDLCTESWRVSYTCFIVVSDGAFVRRDRTNRHMDRHDCRSCPRIHGRFSFLRTFCFRS